MRWPEKLFHFIWRYKLFNQSNLKTREGGCLRIVDFGQYNSDAGPDFVHATIDLDGILWSGHVEIHVREEEWISHKHDLDPKYSNTILHVVWEEIASSNEILRIDGTKVPTLVLKPYVEAGLLRKYEHLQNSLSWIPCENHLKSISEFTLSNWLDRLTVERFEEKANYFSQYLSSTKNDWERVFMIALGRAFGMRVNADVFEKFASFLDLSVIRKHSHSALSVEAMCFGMAGFLEYSVLDSYHERLQSEYAYLFKVHRLSMINSVEWKFLRMRPYNFPTIRLAQFSALLLHSTYWFALIKEEEDLSVVLESFRVIEPNLYWRNHFRFGQESKEHNVSFTADFMNHLVINVFVPLLFLFGKETDNDKYKSKAMDWLSLVAAEKNTIISKFKDLGVNSTTASDSQALLFMHKKYCTQKQCLNCSVGLSILKVN